MAIPTTIREQHEAAWRELFELVDKRNTALRRLEMMAKLAMDMTPATSMVIEFDVVRAEELIAAVDDMTPRITEGMQRVNALAEKCGRPSLRWQKMPASILER